MGPHAGASRFVSLTFLVVVVIVLAGCGSGSSDNQVKRAETQVAAKQRALTDAQVAFQDSSAAFCDSAETYLVSLDRYGDVLNATAATVGDVRGPSARGLPRGLHAPGPRGLLR